MIDDDSLLERYLDYPEVLLKGIEIKKRFWSHLAPWSAGYLGEHVPRPIPAGRVELPLRLDPDLVPAPDFEVWSANRRELTDEEITEEMERVEEEMRRVYPQFFLRNIGRMEMEASPDPDDEWTERDVEITQIDEEALREAREVLKSSYRYEGDDIAASEIFNEVTREWRTLLFKEKWSRAFNKEAKDRTKVPPWAYFPDREMFEKYRGVGIREYIESEESDSSEEIVTVESDENGN